VYLLLCLSVLSVVPKSDLSNAAGAAARELAAGLPRAAGGLGVVLSPLKTPPKDADALAFVSELTSALSSQPGLRVVDRASLQAAIEEAARHQALGSEPSDAVMSEITRAMGAQVLITGSVDKNGSTYLASLRAVDATTGAVLASSRVPFGAAAGAAQAVEGRSLEIELRRLSDLVATGIQRLPGEARYQRFAVLPFEEVGPQAKDKQLGLLVSSQLTSLLARDHNLLMVERAQLAKVIDELSLAQTGLVDPAKSAQVGKLTGAQGLVVGTVSEAGDRYLVDARVVAVTDGQVVSASQVRLPAADLVSLSADAVELRTRAGAVYRSVLLPGWGQLYNRQNEKAAIFAGTEAIAGVLGIFFQLKYQSAYDAYKKLGAGAQFDAKRAEAHDNAVRRNTAIYVLLGLHLINVVDALWNGKTFDSALPPAGSTGLTTVGGF
jgi:TolB-like protein